MASIARSVTFKLESNYGRPLLRSFQHAMIIQQLFSLIPDFAEIQESTIEVDKKEIAFQASVVLNNGYCLGSGFALDAYLARKIALFEAIERKIVLDNLFTSNSQNVLLDEFPTSCGFATGDEISSTKMRAIAEAAERWLRSKWIDDGYILHQVNIASHDLNQVERWLAAHFDEVLYFSHRTEIDVEQVAHPVSSIIVVGLSDEGAFVGSKSVLGPKVQLLPALVEAWRHLVLSAQPDDPKVPELGVIKHFSKNKTAALAQIAQANKTIWPKPTLRLLKQVDCKIDGVFCFRALCNDFQGWHGPNIKRFVY